MHSVLLVADSVTRDLSLAAWLEREGFEVMTAADGQEAVQIAAPPANPTSFYQIQRCPGELTTDKRGR